MNIIEEHISHPNTSLRLLKLELDGFRHGRHRHHHLELTWVEAGEGLRFIGDSVEAFHAGDMVLVGSRVPHAWVSTEAHIGLRHAATVLQFTPEVLKQGSLPELAHALPLVQLVGRGVLIVEPCRSEVIALLRNLAGAGALARLAGLFAILDCLVTHQAALVPIATRPLLIAEGGPQATLQERRIDRVILWIHQHISQELQVAEAARLMHVTPAAFSRLFTREVGKNFTDYVNDIRCGEAQLRLRHSDLPVAVVAQQCGYQTMSHFNKQFLLRTGVTPRAFRQYGRAKPAIHDKTTTSAQVTMANANGVALPVNASDGRQL